MYVGWYEVSMSVIYLMIVIMNILLGFILFFMILRDRGGGMMEG